MYLIGKSFTLETDHNPLISLFGQKNLDALPPRVLRFRLRLMRYDYHITHVAGKVLLTADTLSRAPLTQDFSESIALQESIEQFVSSVVESLPASSDRLESIHSAQHEDPLSSQVIHFCQEGWAAKHMIKGMLKHYWDVHSELSLHNQLL